jgi:hypothetical protein
MIEDVIKSARAALYDRTTSPLFGALIISWVIWNYKFFVILLSAMEADEKLTYIENTLYGEWPYSALPLLGGPLLTALFFLFVYPYPAKWVFTFWRQKQKELSDIRQKIEGATLLDVEQSRRIRRTVIDVQQEHDREIARKDRELESARKRADEADIKVQELEKSLSIAQSTGFTVRGTGTTGFSDDQLSALLRGSPYRLYHNPKRGRQSSKVMLFGSGGRIVEGANANENTWRIADGKLELVQSDGQVHSRFSLEPITQVFTHTNDDDTKSERGQFLIPEPDAAERAN